MNSHKDQVVSHDKFVRSREDPYFDGLLRDDGTVSNQASVPVFQGRANSGKISRSTSDIGETRHKTFDFDVIKRSLDSTFEDSPSNIILQSSGRSSTGVSSKMEKSTSFSFTGNLLDSSVYVGGPRNSIKESSPRNLKAFEQYDTSDLMQPTFVKSYSTNRIKSSLSKIPLPQSAASFYNGFSPQMEIVESSESIDRLNTYLKARRDEVSTGVPGRYLHVVLGQDVYDVGSLVSMIMYAFYLNLVQQNEMFCTVPVINMKREYLSTHAEIKWLLDLCHIDLSSLIFVDEIDLSYYDLFGSLKLVLMNGHKLPTKQEALKDAVVEIFNCSKGESVYPWVETVTERQDCSCCTAIAENFATNSPWMLAEQRFSRFLLAGILLDTGNLTNADCTSKDKYMATMLIKGAGRFGSNGLYQILRCLMRDVSDLRVVDILRKDFKKWTRSAVAGKQDNFSSRSLVSHIGMTSIGISIQQLLAHEDASTQEIKYFQQLEKVRLLMIVSGYYDSEKNFKREILVSAESLELMRNLLSFLKSYPSQLPLKDLHQPGLKEEMKVFEIDKLTSRKTIERLLEDFGGHGVSLLRD